MVLYPECDYFGKRCYDEHAPKSGNCEDCYRFEICSKAKEGEKSLVKNNGKENA